MARQRKEKPDGILIFNQTFKALMMLPDVNAGRVIKAFAESLSNNAEPTDLELADQIVFNLLRADAQTSFSRFERICTRNQKIAEERERERKNTSRDQTSPEDTNLTELNSTELNLTELNLTEREKEHTIFSPPSEDDVRSFCIEQGIKVDPVRFTTFYQARGWRGITDWKALIRSWEAKENGSHRIDGKSERENRDWGELYDVK